MRTRTTPPPPVELTDPIWTVEHLALALRLGERTHVSLSLKPTNELGDLVSTKPHRTTSRVPLVLRDERDPPTGAAAGARSPGHDAYPLMGA